MGGDRSVHPDLEHYYDTATDRELVDAHVTDCPDCRAWLADIHERLGHLACIEFVEMVTAYVEDAVDESIRARIEDHIRLCEGCRNYLDEMQSTVATIGRIAEATEPAEPVRDGLMAAFRAWRRSAPGRRVES